MKKNYISNYLFLFIFSCLFCFSAQAQEDCGMIAPVAKAPTTNCIANDGSNKEILEITEFEVELGGVSDAYAFLVLSPNENPEMPGEKLIAGLTIDGVFDFSTDLAGNPLPPGEYCYQAFAYSQDELDVILTDVNPIICVLFPDTPGCDEVEPGEGPLELPANLIDILGIVGGLAGDFSIGTVIELVTDDLGKDLCYGLADESFCVTVVEPNDPCVGGVGFFDSNAATYGTASNAPNPFTGSTVINFEVADIAEATFNVFDLTGKLVHTEMIQTIQGKNNLSYDATNLTSGVYLYSIENGSTVLSGKMNVQ